MKLSAGEIDAIIEDATWRISRFGHGPFSPAAGEGTRVHLDLYLALAIEVKALREALTEIAKQKLRDEVAKHGPLTQHDFAGGYDVLVCLARAALKPETHSGTE